jgi:hypothetical protein
MTQWEGDSGLLGDLRRGRTENMLQLVGWTWAILSVNGVCALAGTDLQIPEVRFNPPQVFKKESAAVVISARVNGILPTDAVVSLLRKFGEEGERDVGPLKDDGRYGDAQAGDGIYTTKIQLTQKTTEPVLFRVVVQRLPKSDQAPLTQGIAWKGEAARRPVGEILTTSGELRVGVVEHPTFQQILVDLWNKTRR